MPYMHVVNVRLFFYLWMILLKLICERILFSWFEDKHLQGLGVLKLKTIKTNPNALQVHVTWENI